MGNLLRRLTRRYRLILSVCSGLLAAFLLVICAVVGSTDVGGAMQQFMAFAPPVVQVALSQTVAAGVTDAALIAFGWNHPISQALGAAIAITLGARAIAGEIENGAIELVLTQPISRGRYLAAQIVFALCALLVFTVVGVAATVLGQRIFQIDPVAPVRLFYLMITFVLLQSAFFAITLLFSAFAREGGRAAFGGLLIALVSYMISALAVLWPRIEFLAPYSLHHYFDPRARLVDGNLSLAGTAVLFVVSAIAIAAAFWRFQRRDLP